jgi:tRNA A37 threonylcarbamoyladenosine modification protein TsaB
MPRWTPTCTPALTDHESHENTFAEAREAHTLAESRTHELLRATLELVKDEGRQTMKYFALVYKRGPGELSGVRSSQMVLQRSTVG